MKTIDCDGEDIWKSFRTGWWDQTKYLHLHTAFENHYPSGFGLRDDCQSMSLDAQYNGGVPDIDSTPKCDDAYWDFSGSATAPGNCDGGLRYYPQDWRQECDDEFEIPF